MPMLSVLCFALADYDNDCADGGVDDDGNGNGNDDDDDDVPNAKAGWNPSMGDNSPGGGQNNSLAQLKNSSSVQ